MATYENSQKLDIRWDKLDVLPKQNRVNWLFELKLLEREISKNASVLQVGCADATRMIAILERRPDLKITGLDIEKSFIPLAKKKLQNSGLNAHLIYGDITHPPKMVTFDWVICLNNTLGYIADDRRAIENMKKLGKKVIVSVYGERFDNELARDYFRAINMGDVTISNNTMKTERGTVKRYTRDEVESWGGKIIDTPIGYFVGI